MYDSAVIKGWILVSGMFGLAGLGGHMLAEAITKETNVSLEAACIAGSTAVILAGLFINLKRDMREIKGDITKIKKHIGHCRFSRKDVELEDES